MKIKLSIQKKIQLSFIGISAVLYILILTFIGLKIKKTAYSNAAKYATSSAARYATKVQSELNKNMEMCRTMAKAVLNYKTMPEEQWKKLYTDMYTHLLVGSPDIEAVWDSWELKAFNPKWDKDYGRFCITCYRENGKIKRSLKIKSLDGDSPEYAKLKAFGKKQIEGIDNPYQFTYGVEIEGQGQWMTSLTSPILENGRYIGIIGIDIVLSRFEKMIDTIRIYEESKAYLIANNGCFVTNPIKKLIGKRIEDIYLQMDIERQLSEKIKKGEQFSYTGSFDDKEEHYITYVPFTIGSSTAPWGVLIKIPTKVLRKEANKNLIIALMAGLVGLAILSIVAWYISKNITRPILRVTERLKSLAKGEIDKSLKLKIEEGGDEVAEMSLALNKSIDGLLNKKEFAHTIEKGGLDASIELLSESDHLGHALLNMQKSLIKAKKEEEKRKKEENLRQWTNEGVARFAGILRRNTISIENLCFELVKNLVKYIGANQGGMFILNNEDNEDEHYELIASYAYNKRKFIDKKVYLGEGLVGTCALEKEPLYLKEMPESYMEVTSGLGGANPQVLFIMPLKVDSTVLGIVEIASFNEMEDHKIQLLKRVANNIAYTLNSIKTNQQTSLLLQKSQQQAEELASQEEEMRQNLEELQTTQEEALRREEETQGTLNVVNENLFIIELDVDMKISRINKKYLEILDITEKQALGKPLAKVLTIADSTDIYSKIWNDVKYGTNKQIEQTYRAKGFVLHMSETLNAIKNSEGKTIKIMLTGINMTVQREAEEALAKALDEIKKLKSK